jgi:transcription elongation factor SPT6
VFEDLDEIIARYIQPMAAHARDVLNYKYYNDADGGRREVLDRILMDEKRKQPSR